MISAPRAVRFVPAVSHWDTDALPFASTKTPKKTATKKAVS